MNLTSGSLEESTVVKIPHQQLSVSPIDSVETIYGDSRQYEVDLLNQSCQCSEFSRSRSNFPMGDLRRFCRHLVQAQAQHIESLPPFISSLVEVKDLANTGMPNGSASSFFRIDGRLGFFGDYRDQTIYFFVEGISKNGDVFHEFVYDRQAKKWLGNRIPDSPESLLVFAFKERGQYGNQPEKSRKSKRRPARQSRETSSAIKFLVLAIVAGGLGYGGYQLFKDGAPPWLAQAMGVTDEGIEDDKPLSKEEQIAATKSEPQTDDPFEPAQETISDNILEEDPEPDTPPTDAELDDKPDELNEEKLSVDNDDDFIKFRTWTTADGEKTVSARYKSFANGTIRLVREDNGIVIKIDESILSQEDRDYVKQIRMERTLRKAREFKAERDRKKKSQQDQ